MANTKMFVHYGGTVDAFKALANKSSYDNKIVFIKGGNDGKGAAIYTHGEFYTSAHDVEALVSSLKAISGVMVNGDVSTLKVANSHDGVLNFSNGDETVAITIDGPGIKISVSEAFRNRVTNLENSLGAPVANDAGKADGTAYERIAKLSADVAALGGDQGSIAGQINAAIEALDVTDAAVAGKYVSEVSEANGKISVKREDLPTYTLAEGTANGTVKFNGTDVNVHGLGTAAYTDAGAYDAAGTAAGLNNAMDARVKILEAIDHNQLATDAASAAVAGVIDGAPEKFDTLKEIAAWIAEADTAEDAASLVTRVSALEAIDHDAYVGADEANLAAAKQYVDQRFTNEVTGKFDTVGSANAAKEAAIADAAGKYQPKGNYEAAGTAAGLIGTLDATESGTGTNGIKVTVVETDGKITSVAVDDTAVATKVYADSLFEWEEINA